MNRNLITSLRTFNKSIAKNAPPMAGVLGILQNGVQVVEVPGRGGFVYVRLLNSQSELIQAYNNKVSPIYNLPVLLERVDNRWQIVDRDITRYTGQGWGSSPYLPKHGHQHEFDPDNNGGGDLVWVHSNQIYPLALMPSGTLGGPNALIAPYAYLWDSQWRYGGNTGTSDLAPSHNPTGSANARMVLIYMDGPTSVPVLVDGNEFVATATGTYDILSHLPTYDSSSGILLGAVRLVTGTNTVQWGNIYDFRQLYGGASQGSSHPGWEVVLNHASLADLSAWTAEAGTWVATPSGTVVNDDNWDIFLRYNTDIPMSAVMMEATFTFPTGIDADARLGFVLQGYHHIVECDYIDVFLDLTGQVAYDNFCTGVHGIVQALSNDTPYKLKVARNGNYLDFYLDDVLLGTLNTANANNATVWSSVGFYAGHAQTGFIQDVSIWIRR